MWDKTDMLDDDTRKELTAKLEKIGVPEGMIDDSLILIANKTCHKLNRLRIILDEKGISDDKSKEIISGLAAEAMKRNIEEAKQCRIADEHDEGGCCKHYDMCHHTKAEHNMII